MATIPNKVESSSELIPPLDVILQWPTPNYDDPVTRSQAVLIVSCVLGAFMFLVVGARLWARAIIQRNAGLDDWIMLAAMIPTIALTITVCLATERYAFNRHIWDVLPTLYVSQRKVTFALYLLYIVAGSSIKISILLFYRRLDSRSITRTFRILTLLNIAGIALFTIAFVLVLFLSCDPMAAFWQRFDLETQIRGDYTFHCWVDEGADLLSASIISAVQDAIAAFLPTFLYWNLQIPRRQKVALGAIFALGYVVCVVAGVRSYYVWRTFDFRLYDSTWESWPAWLLCVIEIQLGAICASAPALKVFLSHYFRLAATRYGSRSGGAAGGTAGASSLRKGGYWWRSTGASRSLGIKGSREGYFAQEGSRSRMVVDEEGGIVLTEGKRGGGWSGGGVRTDSVENFGYR
ncbi:hypothetical protein BDW02DRAFT_591285 [Decorospora gaudefroyi]|uniref:Rhodopsin domain-containing protein n=1 Tax=Decorospora gaudefroyi TaxID=184978 RepID=A0A6A5K569_9PLEO|nr:hypothetical protein BDW02DRAFT_591285 [Decorospora gaudefroyi]